MARALSFLDRCKATGGVQAEFVARVEGVPVTVDKWETLRRLEPAHRAIVNRCGFAWEDLWRAEQVHGNALAVVPGKGGGEERIVAGVDGLLTNAAGVLLGIYVADCAAVYLVDRLSGALGLIHSGAKGTDLEIAARAVRQMGEEFGTRPEDVEAAISPCIGPPHYEVDFAEAIVRQLRAAGIPRRQVVKSGICTGAQVREYYSYRMEKGKTGRMLALLGRTRETATA